MRARACVRALCVHLLPSFRDALGAHALNVDANHGVTVALLLTQSFSPPLPTTLYSTAQITRGSVSFALPSTCS